METARQDLDPFCTGLPTAPLLYCLYRCVPQALLEYKLVLMNKQEEVMVGLAHVPNRRYSPGLKITTVGEWQGNAMDAWICMGVWLCCTTSALPIPLNAACAVAAVYKLLVSAGNKTSLELRGPVDTKPMHPAQVPMAVVQGLRGAMAAAATGAGAMLRSEQQQAGVQQEEEPVAMQPLHSFSSSREASAEPGSSSPELLSRRRSLAAAAAGTSKSPAKPGQSPFGAHLPATGSAAAQAAAAAAAAGQQPQPQQPALLQSVSSGGAVLAQGPSGSGTPTAASTGFAAKHKHMRRASMQDNSVMETVATEPGTMLVRVTSGVSGPAGSRQLRRM